MAAVLERPGPVLQPPSPADELEMTRARRREGLLGQLPAGPVDRHRGVGVLVRIDPDDDHLRCCLLIRGDAPDRPVDTPEWGRLPRSYEVTPVGPIHARRLADPMEATPLRADIEPTSQVAGQRQRDTHPSLLFASCSGSVARRRPSPNRSSAR